MKFLVMVLFLAGVTLAKADAPNALPEEAMRALHSPTRAVLYSLEPIGEPRPKQKKLHGYQVLGETTLDPKQAQVAADAFRKAVAEGNDLPGDYCFEPRHALRILSEGHTYDFVICYECHWLYVYKDDKELISLGAGGSPKVLNGLLSAAQVPLSHTASAEPASKP